MGFYSRHILPKALHAIMRRGRFQKFRREALSAAHGNILEIGFGSGLNLTEYPSTVRGITALDPSGALFEIARENIRTSRIDVRFIQGSAEQMPFENSSFDTVVSTWTLCSIPDVALALDEIFRVLKSGGFYLFLEHGLHPSNAFFQRLERALTPVWKKICGGCHLHRDIRGLIERHGFMCDGTDFSLGGVLGPVIHVYKGIARKPANP